MSFSVDDKHGYNYGCEASDILDLCGEIEEDICNKREYENNKQEYENDKYEYEYEYEYDKCEHEYDKCEHYECPQSCPAHCPPPCSKPCPKPIPKKGKIDVTVKLNCSDGEPLECVKVNLYRLCGCSPELVASKFTNSCGKVEFKCLDDGNYRVIEIIDKCFFEKPEYYPWNEVCIDDCNKFSEILIINKLKKIEKPCCPPPIQNNCCGVCDGCCGCCDQGCGCCDQGCGGFGGGCGSLIILFLLFGICW